MIGEITADGQRLLSAWDVSTKRLAQQEQAAKRVLEDHKVTVRELAKWLLPDDAMPEEWVGVWYGDSLIQACCDSLGEYHIRIRTRGRSLT